jgi:hypothetical protein
MTSSHALEVQLICSLMNRENLSVVNIGFVVELYNICGMGFDNRPLTQVFLTIFLTLQQKACPQHLCNRPE